MYELSDDTLITQYAHGDLAAFEQLYARHKGGIYRYLLRQVHDQALVDDICQEVWGNVISKAKTYADNIMSDAVTNKTESNTRFKAWLYTIARNKIIDHVRHVKLVKQVMVPNETSELIDIGQTASDTQQTSINTPDAKYQQHAQALAITHCLKKIPQHQLDCFLLKQEAGLGLNTIAEVTQTSLEASKSRLKTAYKNLRACLNHQLDWLSQEAKSG